MSDATGQVRYEKSGRVGSIVFDRPRANSYDLAFMERFNAALDAAEADREVRVVIIRSALERFFCAGADIHAFAANDTAANRRLVDLARSATARIDASRHIYIAAIRGHALGGGFEIALACDLRLGADGDYKLGLPEVNLGLMPGNGGSQRLIAAVGPARALELAVTGRSIGPREAAQYGFFHHLYPADAFEERLRAFAEELACGAPLAMAACKQAVRRGTGRPLADGLWIEAGLVETLYETADAAEGMAAFAERRQPVFRGE